MVVPVAKYTLKRQDEIELRYQLRLMRDAIDKYKQFSDLGLIPMQLGTEGYPKDLTTLVEGVTLVGQLDKKQKFLRRVPIDPMTKKAEWGMRSFQDDPDTIAWGGQNVYDVFSLSDGRAIDGTNYKDW
jgi:general secretion pathway protein G